MPQDNKKNMHSLSGWHQIQHEGKTYVIRTICYVGVVKIVASDFVNVWITERSDDEILKLFREQNPVMECDDSSIIHKMIKDCLSEGNGERSQSSFEMVTLEDKIEFKFKTTMGGLALKLHINLRTDTPQTFYKEVTLPILLIAEELVVRQNLLCQSLEKKDLEISQYKLEGAILARTVVKTQPFSKDVFLSKCYSQNTCKPSQGMVNPVGVLNVLSHSSCPSSNETAESLPDPPSCSSLPNPKSKLKDLKSGDFDSEVNSKSKCDVDSVAVDTPKIQSSASKVNIPKKKKPKLYL